MKRIGLMVAAMGMAAGAGLAGDELDTRSYAELLRADAARYESLQISGGDASLQVTGYMQYRYAAIASDGFANNEDIANGFTQSRIRLGVKGEISDRFNYVLGLGLSSGNAVLLDGNIGIKLNDASKLKVGQFVVQYSREQNVSASRQNAVERSITHSFFTLGRTQGVEYAWQNDDFRFKGALTDGARALNTPINSSAEADFAVTGRLEWKPEGSWSQFNDMQGWRGGEHGLMFGAAAHYQSTQDTFGTTGGQTALDDQLGLTADVSAEFSGGGLIAAWYYQDRETAAGSFSENGLLLQGSVFANDTTELFARWDAVIVDDDRSANAEDLHTLTSGVTFFFIPESHAAKLTLDVQYVLNDLNDSPLSSSDSRTIINSSESQVALRGQLQIRF